jgi:hypothetical protein
MGVARSAVHAVEAVHADGSRQTIYSCSDHLSATKAALGVEATVSPTDSPYFGCKGCSDGWPLG